MTPRVRKFESFAVEGSEKLLFAGMMFGGLEVLDVDDFRLLDRAPTRGVVSVVAAHPTLPYVAISGDELSLWRYEPNGKLTRLFEIPLTLQPEDDYSRSLRGLKLSAAWPSPSTRASDGCLPRPPTMRRSR